jgi:hypothetical protein
MRLKKTIKAKKEKKRKEEQKPLYHIFVSTLCSK